MNTNTIRKTQTITWPTPPMMDGDQANIIITHAGVNRILSLGYGEQNLFMWMLYSMSADNKIIHSTHMLACYSQYAKQMNKVFKCTITGSAPYTRKALVGLVQKGMLLDTDQYSVFMVNPILAYNSNVINRKTFNHVQELYNQKASESIESFTTAYSKVVGDFLSKKKKNYTYGLKNKKR